MADRAAGTRLTNEDLPTNVPLTSAAAAWLNFSGALVLLAFFPLVLVLMKNGSVVVVLGLLVQFWWLFLLYCFIFMFVVRCLLHDLCIGEGTRQRPSGWAPQRFCFRPGDFSSTRRCYLCSSCDFFGVLVSSFFCSVALYAYVSCPFVCFSFIFYVIYI